MLVCVVLSPSVGAPLTAQQTLSESIARQQQHAAEFVAQAAAVDRPESRLQLSVTFGSPDTYRWAGALIGFVTGAVLFTFSGLFWCADAGSACGTEDTIRGIMIGGTLFGFPGMLIGGLFSKHPPNRAEDGRTDE